MTFEGTSPVSAHRSIRAPVHSSGLIFRILPNFT
jgi:hypothetical protein